MKHIEAVPGIFGRKTLFNFGGVKMDFLIVGFLGFCAGFFCAALFSANKCGECKAERMERKNNE